MAVGTDLAVDDVLVVLNATAEATVTVKTLGAGGEVPVPGMEAIPLPASGVITIGCPTRQRSAIRSSSRARSGSSSSGCCPRSRPPRPIRLVRPARLTP